MSRDYVFFAGRRIAWRDSSGNVYDYFVDAIGSTRAATNATGSTCFNVDYYPYGQENDYTTTCSPTYKFTGYEFDSETGNYYVVAGAWYHFTDARFTAWGSSSKVLVPQAAEKITGAVDIAGWAWTDFGESLRAVRSEKVIHVR